MKNFIKLIVVLAFIGAVVFMGFAINHIVELTNAGIIDWKN